VRGRAGLTLALVVSAALAGCVKPSDGIISSTPQTKQRIEVALTEGRVSDALRIAVGYERQVPGPASWALTGRALWRLGSMSTAEAFHRRSASDGHPEGRLGLARALAARGEYDAALEMAAPTVAVAQMAERAGRFVGGVHSRLGDPAAAATVFERAAAAASGEAAARLLAMAEVSRRLAESRPGAPHHGGWTGTAGHAVTEMVDGTAWVHAEIGGVSARLRLDPLHWRSSVTPEFALRIGEASVARELTLPIALGDIRSTAALAVRAASAGDGVLGFDILSDLRWIWSPATGSFYVGSATSSPEEALFQRDLAVTHWVSARTVVDGLSVQLLLVPRIGAGPEVATADASGPTTIVPTAAARVTGDTRAPVPPTLRVLTRVGGWQAELTFDLSPEMGAIGQVPLSTPIVLGADFVRRWSWRWSPLSRQLALVDLDAIGDTRR